MRTSGSKLAPETRLQSLAKLTLYARPSLIYSVDISGTLIGCYEGLQRVFLCAVKIVNPNREGMMVLT